MNISLRNLVFFISMNIQDAHQLLNNESESLRCHRSGSNCSTVISMTKIDKHVLTCLFKFVCPECNTKLKELENDNSIIFCPACAWAWSKKKSVKYS